MPNRKILVDESVLDSVLIAGESTAGCNSRTKVPLGATMVYSLRVDEIDLFNHVR